VKDLVVRREELYGSRWRDPYLDAWAAHLAGSDSLFHDATLCSELAQKSGWTDLVDVRDQASEALLDELTLSARARRGHSC
jgi:hypothetical protein